MTHTPAPWLVFDIHPDKACLYVAPDGVNPICSDVATIYRSNENAIADARLIAAAPELLEALEKATQELHEAIYTRAANTWATPEVAYEHANQLTESYRVLIAKAKGES